MHIFSLFWYLTSASLIPKITPLCKEDININKQSCFKMRMNSTLLCYVNILKCMRAAFGRVLHIKRLF